MGLSFGYGPGSNTEHFKNVIDKTIDLGINFFDTALVYGAGKNEEHVGKFLKPHRQKTFICSKGGLGFAFY